MTTVVDPKLVMKNSIKRLFDLLSSVIVLLLLTPLLLVISLWIRLDSPGPALFRQIRIGRQQQPFSILKFRTMWYRDPNTIDQYNEHVITTGHDPRITRAGRILRTTSLDELPQLWNIFIGDMSVVGPRPILPEQIEVVHDPYVERFRVRPGLTGLAQVRGRRSLGWIDQLAADAEYVKRQGLFFDLGIILRTFVVLFTGSGVYGGETQNWRAYRDSLKTQSQGETSQS